MYGEKLFTQVDLNMRKATDKTKTKKLADLDLLLETIPDTDFNPITAKHFYDLNTWTHIPEI